MSLFEGIHKWPPFRPSPFWLDYGRINILSVAALFRFECVQVFIQGDIWFIVAKGKVGIAEAKTNLLETLID